MGGKKQGAATGPGAGPRGPAVAGPRLNATGPPILAKILGPQEALNNASFDKTRNDTANIVGTVASIVSNIFYPGTGGFAGMAANRTVREQFNTFGGRPFFESTEEPTKDWASLLLGTVGSYAGGAAGSAVGGYVGGAGSAAAKVGAGVGGYVGGQAGGYTGGLVKRSLYGGTLPPSQYRRDPYKRTYIYGR